MNAAETQKFKVKPIFEKVLLSIFLGGIIGFTGANGFFIESAVFWLLVIVLFFQREDE
jgi:hypothetical protein